MNGAHTAYEASSTSRPRRSKVDIEAIKSAIVAVLKADHPITVQFGDHDSSGVWIPKTMEDQIANFNLPTRPTKREDNRHAKHIEGDSVELDALPPRVLRELVTERIDQHISTEELEILRTAEDSERELLERWADAVEGAP
jgi:hypothetical protein